MVALARMLAALRLPKKGSPPKAGAAGCGCSGGGGNEKGEGDRDQGGDARAIDVGRSCCIGIRIDTSSTPSICGFETTCSDERSIGTTHRYDDDTLCIQASKQTRIDSK
jgi:hypothetical protein